MGGFKLESRQDRGGTQLASEVSCPGHCRTLKNDQTPLGPSLNKALAALQAGKVVHAKQITLADGRWVSFDYLPQHISQP
eukprot:3250666-Rhodomonas_salina.1